MQDIPATSIEPALAQSDWQALLVEDPIRACRRYYYQASLLFVSEVDLRRSIAAFQQLTQRSPSHFLKQAQQFLPTILSANLVDVWAQLSERDTGEDNPYLSFVSPYILLQSIVRNARWLNEQAQESHMPSFAADTTTTSSPASTRVMLRQLVDRIVQRSAAPIALGADNRARIRADWQNEVAKLAIVLEELTRPDSVLDVQLTDLHSSLIPYPNETEWVQLWRSDRGGARRRLAEMQMVKAQVGLRTVFSVGESMAAFQAIVRTFPTSITIDTAL
jgi:hypothetical protein